MIPLLHLWFRRSLLAVMLVWAFVSAAQSPVSSGCPVLETVAEIRACPSWDPLRKYPLKIAGLITLVDPSRNLIVLQDSSGALALELGDASFALQVGQQVVLEAADAWPYLHNLARFPDRPQNREVLPGFTWAQSGEGGFFLSRFRSLLHPPATGWYRFFLSSDDSSRLLLGRDESAASRRQIASVMSYTRPQDWSRTPTQRSERIYLEAGRSYYLEAIHHQAGGPSHLGVAWEGPGLPFSEIEGKYLSPFATPEGTEAKALPSSQKAGVLREVYNDVPVLTPEEGLSARSLDSVLSVRGVCVEILGAGRFPEPQQLRMGQSLAKDQNFSWSEIEGTVEFVGVEGDRVFLELTDAGKSMEVIASPAAHPSPSDLRGRRIRVIGVAEAVWSQTEAHVVSRLWLRPKDGVVVTPQAPPAELARLAKISELGQGPQEVLRETAVKFKGRVVSQQGKLVTVSDNGVFAGSVSLDGVNWNPVGLPLDNEMPAQVYVGLAVNSRHPAASSHAVFSQVQGLGGTPVQVDIGSPAISGALRSASGRYLIDGVGTDIWDSPDQFSFVYVRVEGPCSIVARLDSFDPAAPLAKAGLMIRERLAPDGQFIDLVCSAEETGPVSSLQWRWGREGSSTRLTNDLSLKGAAPVWFKLERRYTSIEVLANDPVLFERGEHVNVVGYASIRDGKPLVLGASISRPPRETATTLEQNGWRPLVELSQVNDGTGRWGGFDIFKMRGVVTFCGDVLGRHYWTFQDRSGAALLTPRERSGVFAVKPGQMVEVVGNPGWHPFSGAIYADNVFTLGPAAFPRPIRHPAEYLHPRRGEGSWVELDGIVRAVSPNGLLLVKSRGESFNVAVANVQGASLTHLVDAELRLRGAIVYPSETERLLLVPSLAQVELLVPAPADPFSGPREELRSFSAEGLVSQSRHRVRVSGLVTYAEQGLVYLQDGSGVARLELEEPHQVEAGQSVVVSGFPDWGTDECLVLRQARVRRCEEVQKVVPVQLSAEQVSNEVQLNRVVRLRASVLRTWGASEGETLDLDFPAGAVHVLFPRGRAPTSTLPAGSIVEVTGIKTRSSPGALPPGPSASSAPSSLRLLARGPEDLLVLQTPSWWVLRRTLIIASVVVLAALVSVVWIQLLRRRVRQRTEQLSATMERLQEEASRSATLAERDRLAGEIHDSLEQGLNGIIFQLECTSNLATCSEDVRKALRLACNMAAFSRTEVQYAVWELQSPMFEDSDLLTAVEKISRQIAPESLSATVRVEGSLRRLSSEVEHHLLRVVQEALNNIVKHARATHAEVVLRYGETEVELCITDDGCGFMPDKVRTGGLGHFGLRSLRSRVARIQGLLEVKSEPGKGCSVRVKVPLSNN